jgi:2-polyprenyl-6-hydroxyphenyl methylase/3-demethylubiquinone-9 3-methyltransferase
MRAVKGAARRDRNDTRQYDDLVDEWWRPEGALAALHWLADARASLIPPPSAAGDVLIDVGCGGGLMAPRVHGYHHVGIDVTASALLLARGHGVDAVRASAGAIPVGDGAARVVVAGEVLEHVSDLESVVAELARVTAPGGTIVIDTINATALARFALVTVAERLPGGPPPGIHDPRLFVDVRRLQGLFRDHRVELSVWGIRPSLQDYVAFLRNRGGSVRMYPTRSVALVYQGVGTKAP